MDAFDDAWEHLIVTIVADAEKHADYLRRRWPHRQFPIYAPLALIPELNEIGKLGWELVSLQPVIMGENGDIQVIGDPSLGGSKWTRRYLCTFKRRVRSSAQQSAAQGYGRVSGPLPPLEGDR